MVLSPRRMHCTPPDLNVCFSSRGSSEGSSSSPTFSSRTGSPNWIAFSSVRRCSPDSDSLITLRLLARSMFFTHLFACPCGSIISGHRRALATTMPLSMEKLSLGSPAINHSRILTGSPSAVASAYFLERGMFASAHSATHCSTSSSRYFMVNAPLYDITAELTRTSPVRLVYTTPRSAATPVQRVFSPPRPPISFSARSSFLEHKSTSASSLFFLSELTLSSSSIAASLSRSVFSSDCFKRSPFITSSYPASATASSAFLGATTLATTSYLSIAHTHLHNPFAASDALAAFSGVKLSSVMYFSRMRPMSFGLMLSLS
mmetsp:Transcript_24182/g.45892  ORF Transcript_24182/g.45892 Transcript_24182/m.45892 type:complete len:318 (+) Transcript_24182:74-1027(+)